MYPFDLAYLFDLPANPELLEQRIGRVDRIGKRQEIIIHVPYVRTIRTMEQAGDLFNLMETLLDKSQTLAGKRAQRMRQESLDRMKQILGKEQARLAALARTKPGITDREKAAAKQEEERLSQIMAKAGLRLDDIRLIRLSPSR